MSLEVQYRSLIKKMNVGFALHEIITDSNNNPIDYRFIEINAAFRKLTGFKANELIGRRVTEVIPGIKKSPANWIKRYGKVALTGKDTSFEEYSPELKKWYSIHAYSPQENQFAVLVTDISANKKLEADQAASEEKFRALVEQSITGIYIFAKDRFLYVNSTFCKIFGYTEKEILTKLKPTDVVQREEYDRANENIRRRLEGEVNSVHYIARGKHKKNKPLWIEIHGTHITIDGEAVITGTVLDVTERFDHNKKITESENRFRAAFEQSASGMCITGMDGKIQQMNIPLSQMLGYSENELVGIHFNKFTHPDDLTVGQEFVKRMLAGDSNRGSFEKRYLTKKGKTLWAHINSALVRDAEGNPTHFITQIEDITQKKQIESDLRASEERFSKAFNVGPTGLTITRLSDGRFIDANTSFLDLFEYTRDEVIGRTSTELNMWTPEERQKIIDAQIKSGGLTSIELSAQTKTKRPVKIIFSSKPFELQNEKVLITSMIDITEKHEISRELRQSELRFRTLFEQASVGVGIIETATGKYVSVNKKQCEIVGYSEKEILSSSFMSITHPDDLQEDLEYMKKLRQGKIGKFRMEKRYQHKNGHYVWVVLNVYPLWRPDETQTYHVAICEDITEKKKSEVAIIESEERYRSLFENMNAGFVLFKVVLNKRGRPVDLIIVAGNSGFEKTTGLKMKIVQGKQLTKVLPGIEKDKADWIGTYSKVALTGKPIQFEQGSELLGVYYSVSAFKASTNHCAVTFTDITDSKLATAALHDSEERLRLSTELANVAVWDYDFVSNTMSRSKNHDHLYGLKWQKKWTVDTFLKATHPEDREKSNLVIQKAVAKGGNDFYSFDFRVIHPDKSIRWLNVSGQVTRRDANGKGEIVRGTLIDITDRKNSELEVMRKKNELFESFERYKALITSSNTGAWEYFADSDYLWCSPEYFTMLGRKLKDFDFSGKPNLKQTWIDLLHPEDRERATNHFRNYLKTPEGMYENYFRMLHKDGSWVWVWSRGKIIVDEEGKWTGKTVGTHINITKQKKIEEELENHRNNLQDLIHERTSELERANKELEAFTYSVSHDLRAPLRAMDGFSKFLLEDFGDALGKEGNRLINVIRNNAAKMDQLINDLLQLSRVNKNKIHLEKVNMMRLAKEVLDESITNEDRTAFKVKLGRLPAVHGDENLLRQVWRNLVSNAIKYSGPSKRKEIIINFKKENDDYIFSIRDYGVGFNPKYQDKLFGIFQRLHKMEEFEGTGVGLAIVQRIINRHNGKVWAAGELEKGATFYFTLPISIKDESNPSRNSIS